MPVREVVNPHCSESVITFTARVEVRLEGYHSIPPQRRQEKGLDDQLIIVILVLICF